MTLPIVHHPHFFAALPDGHRFPMEKYRLLAEILHAEGIAESFVAPCEAPAAWVSLAHDHAYVDQVFTSSVPPEVERRIGLPVDKGVARRARSAAAGTVLAARLALDHGLALSTAGGSHHARREGGAGFCVFNDVAVAARLLLADGAIRSALVVDLDVHQGDGTADCLADTSDLFTFSMHAENNYPARKVPSDLDVGLPDGMRDDDYLAVLAEHLPRLLDALHPDIVFFNAGVDTHAEDRLGRLALSDDGIARRDRYVIAETRARGIPLAAVIGGGYSDDIEALSRRHAILFRVATEFAA